MRIELSQNCIFLKISAAVELTGINIPNLESVFQGDNQNQAFLSERRIQFKSVQIRQMTCMF